MKAFLTICLLAIPLYAVEPVASGAKVFIEPMDGFETYIAAAFREKKVPLTVVADPSVADYRVTGTSESQKAGWAKVIFQHQTGSREEASISVIDVRTSEVVFAYNYNSSNSYRGKQSAAESCAKHLAKHIKKGGRLASSLPPVAQQLAEAGRTQESATIRFTSAPENAEIEIDGQYWGSTSASDATSLGEGTHKIVIRKPGYEPWERSITLQSGDDRSVHADLLPEPQK